MAAKTLLYVGAAILFIIGLLLLVWGFFNVVASTAPGAQSSQSSVGLGWCGGGVVFLAAGIGVVYAAARAGKTEVIQQVTTKIDLPGYTKISQMTCRNCGGALKPENIQMVSGAPMVVCPYCGTTYQLTEEPKW